MSNPALRSARVDHVLISEMVAPGSRVLDVGCGDGELLQLLTEQRGVDGRGVEIDRNKVNACVARGLSVIQGDADRDLANYPDQAFDYAVLSLTYNRRATPNPCSKTCCASDDARLCPFRISDIGKSALDCCLRAGCR